MSNLMIPIWRPQDAREVFQRAATFHASKCPAALVQGEFRFTCDVTGPHETHTNAALNASWVGEL